LVAIAVLNANLAVSSNWSDVIPVNVDVVDSFIAVRETVVGSVVGCLEGCEEGWREG